MVCSLLIGFLCFVLWLIFVDSDFVTLFYDILHRYVISAESRRRSLKGKVVWITGASSGIGEAIAYDLAQYGCRLILSARREDRLSAVKARCVQIAKEHCGATEFDHSQVSILPFDVLEIEQHPSVVNKAQNFFNRIDILVNNAGRTQRFMFEDAGMDVLNAVLKLDFISPMSLTRHVIPIMKAQDSGKLININSVGGKFGSPNSSVYCASKFALKGLWESLRLELVPYNITALTVCPGQVQTQLFAKAFTEDLNVTHGERKELKETKASKMLRLTPERCAQIVTLGIVADLKEVWISKNPVLLIVYLMQYCPAVSLFIAPFIASFVVRTLRDADVPKKKD